MVDNQLKYYILKFFLSFLLLLFFNTCSVKAQQYVPLVVDSTHWFTTPSGQCLYPPPYSITEYYLVGDTSISSINYKKVYYRTETQNSCSFSSLSSNFSLFALLREDTTTKKVYAILFENTNSCPLNQEVLLYDFDLQVGDTLKQQDLCLLLNDDVVTSTFPPNDWIPTANAYHLSDGGSVLYEGVGSTYGLFDEIFISVSGPQPLLYDYCRGGLSNCNYLITSVDNLEVDENINVFPNPIIDWFTIQSLEYFEFSYRVFSIDGALILENKSITNNKIPFAVNKGIYFYQIISQNKSYSGKLIKN